MKAPPVPKTAAIGTGGAFATPAERGFAGGRAENGMKKRDLLVIAATVVCAVALVLVSGALRKTPEGAAFVQGDGDGASVSMLAGEGGLPLEPASAAAEDAMPGKAAADAEAFAAYGLMAAESYMCVWLGDNFRLVPLVAEAKLSISRVQGEENIVAVGVNRFHVESASCPDQVCIAAGEVSLANRNARVLQRCVICLPNEVVLELLDAGEALALLETSGAVLAGGDGDA